MKGLGFIKTNIFSFYKRQRKIIFQHTGIYDLTICDNLGDYRIGSAGIDTRTSYLPYVEWIKKIIIKLKNIIVGIK